MRDTSQCGKNKAHAIGPCCTFIYIGQFSITKKKKIELSASDTLLSVSSASLPVDTDSNYKCRNDGKL